MARLHHVQGPHPGGPPYLLEGRPATIGRQPGVDLVLEAVEVSRQHARITCEEGQFFLEDLGSSNGTYLNGVRLKGRAGLRERDQIKIGPFLFRFEAGPASLPDTHIRAELVADASNRTLIGQDPAAKLIAVLEISRQLARSLDLDDLLPRLLDQLLALFRQADRGLILIREGERLLVRALCARQPRHEGEVAYSRAVVRRVLEEGVGIMADDAQADQRFVSTNTLASLGIRSFLCVPIKDHDNRALGVLQVDRFGHGVPFSIEDLHLLTTIALQVAVVLENAALHAKLLEQERVKRDLELARLSQLVAGIAHEINNPLAFIRNNLSVFRRDVDSLQELLALYQEGEKTLAGHEPALLQRIRACAAEADLPVALKGMGELLTRSGDGLKRIQQIVLDLREFARLDRSQLDELDLNPGIESTVSIIRGRAERQHVELLDLGALPGVTCYPAKINQVVFNLLANAIDACPEGGKVTVRTRPVPAGVEVTVSDTGRGIDPAIRDKIFDPFFTTKPLGKGVGLGLSISYGIVQGHGGTIECDSTPGQGTRFTIRLPLKPPETVPGEWKL